MVIKNCIKTCTTENLQTFFISNYRFKHLKIYPPLLGKFIELNTHVYVKEHKLVFRPLEVILQKSNFLEFWSRNSHDFSILNELKDYHFLKEKSLRWCWFPPSISFLSENSHHQRSLHNRFNWLTFFMWHAESGIFLNLAFAIMCFWCCQC